MAKPYAQVSTGLRTRCALALSTMTTDQTSEVLARLAAGRSMEGLALGVRNGRVNLNGLTVAHPTAGKPKRLGLADVAPLQGQVAIRGVTLRSLDFSGS